MKVSSSRQPPPKVTTTAFRLDRLGDTKDLPGESPNRVAAAVAPVTTLRKSRRLQETASVTPRGLSWFTLGNRSGRIGFLAPFRSAEQATAQAAMLLFR
jgi:hypothetical protein